MSVLVSFSMVAAAAAPCPLHQEGDLVVGPGDRVPPCLETVNGNLQIGSQTGHLVFERLTDVTGRLEITLSGAGRASFPALERVHRGLEVQLRGTGRLELPRLSHVSGPVGLDLDAEHPAHGLPRLRRLDGGLWIFGGGRLGRLLPTLRRVGGTVYVQPTGPMRGLLPALEWVGGHLVSSNGRHAAITGFTALREVDGGVYLFGGERFSLPRLERVGGALAVRDSRFESLEAIGAPGARVGALLLRDNPALAQWPGHLRVAPDRVQVLRTPAHPPRGHGQPW